MAGTPLALLRAYVLLTALVVAINRMFAPIYYEHFSISDELPWFMAVGVVLLLLLNFSVVRPTRLFYAALGLLVTFTWVWMCSTYSDSDIAHTAHAVWWPGVDAVFVVMAFAEAQKIWNSDPGTGETPRA